MFKTSSIYFEKIKNLLLFALPIMIGNIGQMLIGAGDVFIAAKHSTNTLAAISIANAIIAVVFLIGLGFLFSISPVLSQKRGEGESIDKYFKLNIYYSLITAAVFSIISLSIIPFIPIIGFDKTLVPDIQEYIFICSFSFFGAYLHQSLKEFLQSFEKVFFANILSIIAIFLNLLLNFIFVFGYNFIPSLGVKGLAIASLTVRAFMGLALLFYCRQYLKTKLYFDIDYLKKLFKIAYPLSLSLLLEMSAFSSITLIAGKISNIQVAAHNIVLTFASISFMLPMSVSNALSVKIGYAYGSKNYNEIKQNLFSGIIISLFIMSIFMTFFFTMPEFLINLFSQDTGIIAIGSSLLVIAALFQMLDGTQITLSGALKGLGLTKPIMTTMFISYWIIGIPIGIYFAFACNMQVFGLWMGLAVALLACCTIFSIFLTSRLRKIKEELLGSF